MGLDTSFKAGWIGCDQVLTMPRSCTCGSAKTSPNVLMAPQGTLAASSAPSQLALVRVFMIASSWGTNSARWRTRSAFNA